MLLLFMWNKNIDKKFISLRKTPHLIKDEVSFLKTKRKGSNEFVWCSSLPHLAESVRFELTWGLIPKRFSRPPRYDRFDNSPHMKLYQTPRSKSRKFARKLRETLLAKCIRGCEKPNKIKGF